MSISSIIVEMFVPASDYRVRNITESSYRPTAATIQLSFVLAPDLKYKYGPYVTTKMFQKNTSTMDVRNFSDSWKTWFHSYVKSSPEYTEVLPPSKDFTAGDTYHMCTWEAKMTESDRQLRKLEQQSSYLQRLQEIGNSYYVDRR
jgi:hypothetical protein